MKGAGNGHFGTAGQHSHALAEERRAASGQAHTEKPRKSLKIGADQRSVWWNYTEIHVRSSLHTLRPGNFTINGKPNEILGNLRPPLLLTLTPLTNSSNAGSTRICADNLFGTSTLAVLARTCIAFHDLGYLMEECQTEKTSLATRDLRETTRQDWELIPLNSFAMVWHGEIIDASKIPSEYAE
ncbi:hypothetical protein B0H19DRAFT_1085875 [Mycena capillaripes]|nr:hypothetical protein B0H19DRAFT_1085875 [Mycena capillaripes]